LPLIGRVPRDSRTREALALDGKPKKGGPFIKRMNLALVMTVETPLFVPLIVIAVFETF